MKQEPKLQKAPLSNLSPFYRTLQDVVFVLEHGKEKYQDDYNWKEYESRKDIDAALRHILDQAENPLDHETERPALTHAICRLLFANEKLYD